MRKRRLKVRKHRRTKRVLFIAAVLLIAWAGLSTVVNSAAHGMTIEKRTVHYHLDMGVQLAYNEGCSWGDRLLGDTVTATPTVAFGKTIGEIIGVYPLRSVEGRQVSLDGENVTHNIPAALGGGEQAYYAYYERYAADDIQVEGFSQTGNRVSINYEATLNSASLLEVTDMGAKGQDGQVYTLFGGRTLLNSSYPKIGSAVETALQAGKQGTAQGNKLYLIFCPNIIEYEVVEVIDLGELKADISVPATAEPGESYTVADSSYVSEAAYIKTAVLEKDSGNGWKQVAFWQGSEATKGQNTGGSMSFVEEAEGMIFYRLTVETDTGLTDTAIKVISIEKGYDIEGEAILSLPDTTYEGHRTVARDESEFTVDGKIYDARGMYEAGLATNSFRPVGISHSMKKTGITTRDIVFREPGNAMVQLTVDAKGGSRYRDVKSIEVLKTPCISESLGGFQKQNRRQILNIRVAVNPNYPLEELWVELAKEDGSERVKRDAFEEGGILVSVSGEALAPAGDVGNSEGAGGQGEAEGNTVPTGVSDTIKTRPLKDIGTDEQFIYLQLEFLTKNTAEEVFTYEVYAKDSRGNEDRAVGSFRVQPDLPPQAKIGVAAVHIRERGENFAYIDVEDITATDGDQLERTWHFEGDEWADVSFGTMQKFVHKKEGVGISEYRLEVRDVWTEPTLEEFVSEEDRLRDTATAVTTVENIAPVVSLEISRATPVQVAVMTERGQMAAAGEEVNGLKKALIEQGFDPQVRLIPIAEAREEPYAMVGFHRWDTTVNCRCCRGSGLIFDSRFAYSVEPSGIITKTRSSGSTYQECEGPHTLYALRATPGQDGTFGKNPLERVWSYTVSETGDFKVSIDEEELYCYISGDSSTIILNRNTGAYLTTLPVSLPATAKYWNSDKNRLYFFKGSNIGCYDFKTGILTERVAAGGDLGTVWQGRLTFVGKEADGDFYIGRFDLDSERVEKTPLPVLEPLIATEYTEVSDIEPVAMDGDGRVIFYQEQTDSGDTRACRIWYTDEKTGRVRQVEKTGFSDLRNMSLGYVQDEAGNTRAVFEEYGNDNSTKKTKRRYHYVNLYEIDEQGMPMVVHSLYGKKDNRLNWQGISYGKYHSDSNSVFLFQGSIFQGYDWGGSVHGTKLKTDMNTFETSLTYSDWDWEMLAEYADYKEGNMLIYYDQDAWVNLENKIMMYKTYMSAEQAKQYALKKYTDMGEREDTIWCDFNEGLDIEAVVAEAKRGEPAPEEPFPMVYEKGELIKHDIYYSDYEHDPSKAEYWRYTHRPFNDGEHPLSGAVLAEPITKFYIDGKYTVEHWQVDDTSRGTVAGGNPGYDKGSNHEIITFYIEGFAEAPEITYIRTVPERVEHGETFRVSVGVDDKEKEELHLTTEVFFEQRQIYTHSQGGLLPDAQGQYPEVVTGFIMAGEHGWYNIVCTVRDELGTGMGTYYFRVLFAPTMEGKVLHTEIWEARRLAYNGAYPEAPRAESVFWAGEALVLEATADERPTAVRAEVAGYPYMQCQLEYAGAAARSGAITQDSVTSAEEQNASDRKTKKGRIRGLTASYDDEARGAGVQIARSKSERLLMGISNDRNDSATPEWLKHEETAARSAGEMAGINEEPSALTGSAAARSAWRGVLYHKDMLTLWQGKQTPVTVQFTAYYPGGVTAEAAVTVLVEDAGGFIRLHRAY